MFLDYLEVVVVAEIRLDLNDRVVVAVAGGDPTK